MSNIDPLGIHAGQYKNDYTQAENARFASEFDVITQDFRAEMLAGTDPVDPKVQDLVQKHYEFILQFWKPSREAYKSLAMSYILPSPYRDTYESIEKGLAQYHYNAIVIWADKNL